MSEDEGIVGSQIKQFLNQKAQELSEKADTAQILDLKRRKEAVIRIARIMSESDVINMIYEFTKSEYRKIETEASNPDKLPEPNKLYVLMGMKAGLLRVQRHIEGYLIHGEKFKRETEVSFDENMGDSTPQSLNE